MSIAISMAKANSRFERCAEVVEVEGQGGVLESKSKWE
jgi:hypothetical protein